MIVIVIDGLRVDFAEDYFDLPLDLTVKDTWFPSLTGCVHLSLLTGRSPAQNNIPSMRWMDKETGKKRTYFNLTGSMDQDYNGKTLIDDIDSSVSIFSPVSKGFKKNIPPIGHIISHGMNTWELFDKLAFKVFQKYEGTKLRFMCLYGVDEISHRFGLRSKRTINACKMLNERLYELIEKTEEEVILLSDHGLTETHTHIDLVRQLKKTGYSVKGFPFYLGSQDIFAAVCGNSLAHIYLKEGVKKEKVMALLGDINGLDKVYTSNLPENDNIFDSSRTGDIVVTAKSGYDLRTWEIPEHKSSHGSNCPEHYKVPVFTNKRLKGKKISIF